MPPLRLIYLLFKINNMRIGIDARFYGPIGKGLGRYIQEVVDNILRLTNTKDSSLSFVIFLSPENFDEFVCENSKVKKICLSAPWYSWKEQILMPFYIWREKLDLIHYPHFNVPILTPCKFVVTIHDLILTHFPTLRATTLAPYLYWLKNLAYKIVIVFAIRRSKKIITVSEFTKNDICSQFKVSKDKIIVTYEGVANLAKGSDSLFVAKQNNQETLRHYNINNNFLLYVGNAYPHKNLDWLLKVFKKLVASRPSLKLVLVGKEDYFYNRVHEAAKNLNLWGETDTDTDVIFPGYVPDAQLEVLYQEAKAYVFPSLYEGFGLPPLEAMANSCPVISSDRASLPEILGSAALYFNPENEDDFIEKITKLLDNKEIREKLVGKGLEQIKKYSWSDCAQETLNTYSQILNEKK